MELFSVASGSSGNCICVGSDSHHIMIDAGISGKRIEDGMNSYDLSTKDMEGILITHEHSDHISGLGVISRRYGLPIYATQGTLQAIQQNKSLGQIDPGLFVEIEAEKDFQIGDLTIHPISVSHDAADPVAYRVNSSDKSVAVLTDLGCFDSHIIESMQNLDAILLEANHDVNMLQVGGYPYQLKMRILGERGHLSNELSGQLLCELLHDNMKYVLLGHLSNENNFPDLALKAVKMEVTLGDNPYKASDFQIEVASRSNISERIIV